MSKWSDPAIVVVIVIAMAGAVGAGSTGVFSAYRWWVKLDDRVTHFVEIFAGDIARVLGKIDLSIQQSEKHAFESEKWKQRIVLLEADAINAKSDIEYLRQALGLHAGRRCHAHQCEETARLIAEHKDIMRRLDVMGREQDYNDAKIADSFRAVFDGNRVLLMRLWISKLESSSVRKIQNRSLN